MASGFIQAAREQTGKCPHCRTGILEEDLERFEK